MNTARALGYSLAVLLDVTRRASLTLSLAAPMVLWRPKFCLVSFGFGNPVEKILKNVSGIVHETDARHITRMFAMRCTLDLLRPSTLWGMAARKDQVVRGWKIKDILRV